MYPKMDMIGIVRAALNPDRRKCWKDEGKPTRFGKPRLSWKNQPKMGKLIRAFGTANIDCIMMVPADEYASSARK